MQKDKQLSMEQPYRKIFELALPFLDTRENLVHTREAFDLAVQLLQAEGGDPRVVLPGIILHDVGWKSVSEDLQLTAFGPGEKDMELNRIHEREGARIACEILEKVNYPPHLVEEITSIVLGHDSIKEAMSINDAIVKDADKLWRYSKNGHSINAKRFSMTFQQNVDRLRNHLDVWFLTATGKNMARERLRLFEKSLESATCDQM